jgi:release factor glutamine methyltransferase
MNKTVSLALQGAYDLLSNALIDNARLNARILLQHACNLTHEQITLNPHQLIDTAIFDNYIIRCINHEPIAYILNMREFYGINFIVSKDTLIPRPDSETLIETVIDYYKDKNAHFNILDLGTGSGCLLLTLLKEFPNASGVGVDVSNGALTIATNNAENLNLSERAKFIHSDWFENINDKFDLVIGNPPYIKNDEKRVLAKNVIEYEPHLALFGGKEGLDSYYKIARSLTDFLKNDAIAIFEFGQNQHQQIAEIFLENNFKTLGFRADLSGIIRCIVIKKI